VGGAIAGAASLVLAFGESIDVQLRITTVGRVDWPAVVIVAAGTTAVACYACRVGVPRRTLLSVAALGAVAVVLTQGLTPVSADLSRIARTLLAALVIGAVGRMLAHRSGAPAALWMVPAILPLLPSPSTLVPSSRRPKQHARLWRARRGRRHSLSASVSRPAISPSRPTSGTESVSSSRSRASCPTGSRRTSCVPRSAWPDGGAERAGPPAEGVRSIATMSTRVRGQYDDKRLRN
jgi:hypothetical protein